MKITELGYNKAHRYLAINKVSGINQNINKENLEKNSVGE